MRATILKRASAALLIAQDLLERVHCVLPSFWQKAQEGRGKFWLLRLSMGEQLDVALMCWFMMIIQLALPRFRDRSRA